ncbi:ScbA/BarX family gamma-butyrolactone biosynthesis protein [Streptomyces alkaliphilus]|uniref:ScbA/BarX family gamma-butyrolactone biosynthesis protein n=1 Tax=Streptomyces alkaliphilus TaxID=1472722 RepID=UPI0015F7AAF3|nr:ScbA/BarX family gamma-butyrolactone biosynthesis protein [Streptomyces alkaliphilus]
MLRTQDGSVTVRPTLTTTVAKEYVHRAALAEVFLTGWNRVAPDSFVVTAQWPRTHSFYSSEYGTHDPLLLCETIRQCGLLLTHTAYDVPFGYQISWSRLQYSANPRALHTAPTPAEITLHVKCTDVRYHRTLPASMSMHMEAVRDGSLLSIATVKFGQHSPNVYRRLRGGRGDAASVFSTAPKPPDPVALDLVGRTCSRDIVLSPTSEHRRWNLRVDTTHPVLFDHPIDHVPGMLLLESIRQAGHALAPSNGAMAPTSMDVSFNRYVEFDSPCWIEAEPSPSDNTPGRHPIRVNAVQGGSFAFTASAEMTDVSNL